MCTISYICICTNKHTNDSHINTRIYINTYVTGLDFPVAFSLTYLNNSMAPRYMFFLFTGKSPKIKIISQYHLHKWFGSLVTIAIVYSPCRISLMNLIQPLPHPPCSPFYPAHVVPVISVPPLSTIGCCMTIRVAHAVGYFDGKYINISNPV